ncbi:MAG: leucine-rich repeat protein [Dorea sp.]|nr:leucine-rich repeat protein [Dorea sp.]
MKKRILSVALILCLCISFQSTAYAWQEEPSPQEEIAAAQPASEPATRDSTVPAPAEAYKAMIALKNQDAYKEGTPWTDYEPYSDSKGYYYWKGGNIDGKRISAVGCVAFAFILSDAAFGSLPARMSAAGSFKFEDIKAGDILRVNNDTHTVIVLETGDAGIVVAEGNISDGDHKGKVHWGRAISKEEVMRTASHYITRYPEGYMPPDDSAANDIIGEGALGGGLTWKLTKAGTLTVSGKGAMPDFESADKQPWSGESSKIRKIVIGNGVTSVGSCAFRNCGALSAEISSSVKIIGNSAFQGSSLVSAAIPSSVKTVGDSAFRECKNLSSAAVSEGVESIGQNAFRACTKLTSIALPASIGEVGAAAFFQCQAMASVSFAPGSKQVKLGDNLFTQCYYLMRVTLPKSINGIGDGMFQNCMMLAGVEIPQGAERIGGSAFASCTGFTTVIIPDSVTEIGTAAFAQCTLKDIYFTGSETQWNSVSKSEDTKEAVSKARMHYNYKPGGGGSGGNGGGSSSGGNGGGSSEDTKVPEQTPVSSIVCKKAVYTVSYGAKPFKVSASSKSRMTFTSSSPKIASVNKDTGKVTVKNTGIAVITIKAGKDSEKVTIKVTPKKQSVKSAKAAKGKKLTVKWVKDKRASGYQVQISTDKEFKKNVQVRKLSKTSCTFKKLKKGKRYYVRIRSYKKSGKETLYGAWSKRKLSGRIKK